MIDEKSTDYAGYIAGHADPMMPLKTIYNNSCSSIPTRFLTGAQLIKTGNGIYGVESENWAYPKFSFGDHESSYYAEAWMNGMDYNYTYWAIEQANYGKPTPIPLIHFPETKDREGFQDKDFENMCKAFMHVRRYDLTKESKIISYKKQYGIYDDMTWPVFRIVYKDGHTSHVFKTTKLKKKFDTSSGGEEVIPTMEGVEMLRNETKDAVREALNIPEDHYETKWVKCVYGITSEEDCYFYVNKLFLEKCLKTN